MHFCTELDLDDVLWCCSVWGLGAAILGDLTVDFCMYILSLCIVVALFFSLSLSLYIYLLHIVGELCCMLLLQVMICSSF